MLCAGTACVSSGPSPEDPALDRPDTSRSTPADSDAGDAGDVDAWVDVREVTGRDDRAPDDGFDADADALSDGEEELVCAAPMIACEGTCLRADSREHCGACGATCTPGQHVVHMRCVGGRCVIGACEEGRSSCDGDPETGCETRLVSREHCGACNNACGLDADCSEGRCVPSPMVAIAAHQASACAMTAYGAVRCWGALPWRDAPMLWTELLSEAVPLDGGQPWSLLLDDHGLCAGTSHQVFCWSPEEERWALVSGLPAEELRSDATLRTHVVGVSGDAPRCALYEGSWRCWSVDAPEESSVQPWQVDEVLLQGLRCSAEEGAAHCVRGGSGALPWTLGGQSPWPLLPCVTTACSRVPDEPFCLAGEECGASMDRVCMRGGCHRREQVTLLWGEDDTICGWSPVASAPSEGGRVVCFGEEGSFAAPILVGDDLPHTLTLQPGGLVEGGATWVATPDGLRCLGWDRRLVCWGESAHGSGGVMAFVPITLERAVLTTLDERLGDLVEARGGDGFLCVLHAHGEVLCRGDNALGQLGDGTGRSRVAFASIARVACGREPC